MAFMRIFRRDKKKFTPIPQEDYFITDHKGTVLRELHNNVMKLKSGAFSSEGENEKKMLQKYFNAQRVLLIQAAKEGASVGEIKLMLLGDDHHCVEHWVKTCISSPDVYGASAATAMMRLEKELQDTVKEKLAEEKNLLHEKKEEEKQNILSDKLRYAREINKLLNESIARQLNDEDSLAVRDEIEEKLFHLLSEIHAMAPDDFSRLVSENNEFDIMDNFGEYKPKVVHEQCISLGTLGKFLNFLEWKNQPENSKSDVKHYLYQAKQPFAPAFKK